MTDNTPTTDEIRELWGNRGFPRWTSPGQALAWKAEFDRWLTEERAKAFQSGWAAAQTAKVAAVTRGKHEHDFYDQCACGVAAHDYYNRETNDEYTGAGVG